MNSTIALFFLAQVLLALTYTTSSKVQKQGPSGPSGPSVQVQLPLFTFVKALQLKPQWPYIKPTTNNLDLNKYSSLFLKNSVVEGPNGQSDTTFLQNFQADSRKNSVRMRISQKGSVTVLPVGNSFAIGQEAQYGVLFVTGDAGLVVSWSQRDAQGRVSQRKQQLGNSLIAQISIATLEGPVTVRSNQSGLEALQAQMWSEQLINSKTSTPPGHYVVQPYLSSNGAYRLVLSPLNTCLALAKGDAPPGAFQFGTSVECNTTQEFLEAVNAKLSQLTLGDLQVTMNSDNILVWTNSNADENYYLTFSDSITNQQRCATAATFGLYEKDEDGITVPFPEFSFVIIISSDAQPNSIPNQRPIVLQWPITATVPVYAVPGSCDSDGLVRIYPYNDDENVNTDLDLLDASTIDLEIKASDRVQRLVGPISLLGPVVLTRFTLDSGTVLECTSVIASGATTSMSQELDIESISISNQEELTEWYTLYENETVNVAVSAVGGPVVLIAVNQDFNALFLSGPTEYTVASSLLDNFTVSDRPIEQFLQLTLTILNSGSGKVYGSFDIQVDQAPEGTDLIRYTQESPNVPLMFGQGCIIEAWAAGGGSMLSSSVPTFGGASSRGVTKLEAPIYMLETRVGTKGVQVSTTRCSGGSSTYVRIDDSFLLMHLGGGGGAAIGSHGGQGGLIDGRLTNGPSTFGNPVGPSVPLEGQGYSGSTDAFDTARRDDVQELGPSGKPSKVYTDPDTKQLVVQFETLQGSGSAVSLDGDPGYFVDSSGTKISTSEGGLGGYGYKAASTTATTRGGAGMAQSINDLQSAHFLGGGGGGSTMMLSMGNLGPFQTGWTNVNAILIAICRPPFSSFNPVTGPVTGPYGGGSRGNQGFLYESRTWPWYTVLYGISNQTSILGTILDSLKLSEHNALVTRLLQAIIQKISVSSSTSSLSNSTTDNYFALSEQNFVNYTETQSYVPMALHNTSMPSTLSELRLVQNGELQLLNYDGILNGELSDGPYNGFGFVLCVINDGQFDPANVRAYEGLPIKTLGIQPAYTSVVQRIVFRPSRPRALYTCVYIVVEDAISTLQLGGPLVIDFQGFLGNPNARPTLNIGSNFTFGTALYGSLVDTVDALNGRVYALAEVAPFLDLLLSEAIAFLIRRTDRNTSVADYALFHTTNNRYALPFDTLLGPSYINQVWPVSNGLSVKVYVRKALVPQTSNFNSVSVQQFFYTGTIQYFTVPLLAKSVTVYAFGAGGHRVQVLNSQSNDSYSGADGSFVKGTFTNLAAEPLEIYVGRGGSYTSLSQQGSELPFCGGRDIEQIYALGGGFSGVSKQSKFFLVAGGGGSAGTKSSALVEGQTIVRPQKFDGSAGLALSTQGQDSIDPNSGPGGSGLYGGLTGVNGFAGGHGRSLVPKNGLFSNLIRQQKYFTATVGLGFSRTLEYGTVEAQDGLVVLEVTY